jgi:hypothetical protein
MMDIGPRVFEQIFNKYCRPRPHDHPDGRGGELRDFSVTEIAAKAAELRSEFRRLFELQKWKLEDWITNDPVLP